MLPLLKGGASGSGTGRTVISSDTTWYVNNLTGNDTTGTGAVGFPFRTIQHAVDTFCNTIYVENCNFTIQVETTGVNYAEVIVLKPWQGFCTGIFNMPSLQGDVNNMSAVTIAPTANPNFEVAVINTKGDGADWNVMAFTTSGGSAGSGGSFGHYSAYNGARLHVWGARMGVMYDPVSNGVQNFLAFQNSYIKVHSNIFGSDSQSHIFGGNASSPGLQGFVTSYESSEIDIDCDLKFDTSIDYYICADAEQESRIWYGHNCGFSYAGGVTVTGTRYFFRENSFGYSAPAMSTIPGTDAGPHAPSPSATASDSCFSIFAFGPGAQAFGSTYANLNSSVIPRFGMCATISDGSTTTLGAICTGGGANNVVIWYDGANWRVAIPNGTASGSIGGADTQVQFNNTGAFDGSANLTWVSPALTIGKASSATGKLILKGTTSGAITITSKAAAGTWTATLPDNDGNANDFLQTDGSGNLSWAAGSGSSGLTIGTTTISSGTTKRVLYDLAGVLQEAAKFTIESGSPNVANKDPYLYNTSFSAITADTGSRNWFFGPCGNTTATGQYNIGVGFDFFGVPLSALTSGNSNLCISGGAGQALTSGSNNIFLGTQAGTAVQTTSDNVAIGSSALKTAVSPDTCVAIGSTAMASATGGSGCVAIGTAALAYNTSGSSNLAIGASALTACTSGSNNVGIGAGALAKITTDFRCIGIGSGSLQNLVGSTTQGNIGIGYNAGLNATGADRCTLIGYQIAGALTTGSNTTAIGNDAAPSLTTGTFNTFIGDTTGGGITTGSYNTIIGSQVSGLATTLANNVIIADGQGNIRIQHDATDIYLKNSATFATRYMTTLTAAGTGNVPTLTAGPVTGDPTKWFAIDDNGTTRYIPSW